MAHKTIKKVTQDIEHDKFNTAVSAMMQAVNSYFKLKETYGIGKSDSWKFAIESLLQILAPFAPHITDELWREIGHKSTIHVDNWPNYDEKYLFTDSINIVVQINGKLRANIEVPIDSEEQEVVDKAKADQNVASHLQNKEVRKVIYVPRKIVNFVVEN